jgi:hydroxymethylpyrimidine pyrophosphatase-like HAD family hydrolase
MKLLEEYKNIKGIKKIRKADNIFAYIVVDNKIFDLKYIELFINKIKDLNWETYINRTKIYFLPQELKKSTAIKYICDKFGYKNTFGIGDSIMDKDMLDFCRSSYLLRHGDLVNSLSKENKYIISRECGFRGSEEVLKYIISYK